MTDLEMTKLCADAMGLDRVSVDDSQVVQVWHGPISGTERYNPLHRDAQAMALVKKMDLMIVPSLGGGQWFVQKINSETDNPDEAITEYEGIHESLNRAIVECVAKMQKGKK